MDWYLINFILTIVALIASISGLKYAHYIANTRVKKIPHPEIEKIISIQKIYKAKSEKIEGYEGWITVRNNGMYQAHDVHVSIGVPLGAEIQYDESPYFNVLQNKNHHVVFSTNRLVPGFVPPSIHFFSDVEPDIQVWNHEQKGTVKMPQIDVLP